MNIGWRERNQQDATNLMFITKLLSRHVSGIIMPIIRRTSVCTAAYGVLHWLWSLWLCGAGLQAVCTVKVTVSSRTVTFTVYIYIYSVTNFIFLKYGFQLVVLEILAMNLFAIFCNLQIFLRFLEFPQNKILYVVLPKISENLLVITWILTLSPNFYRHLRSSHLGLVYNDPSDFATFGSTHWSLLALVCLVSVAIVLGPLQWRWNVALSTGVSF